MSRLVLLRFGVLFGVLLGVLLSACRRDGTTSTFDLTPPAPLPDLTATPDLAAPDLRAPLRLDATTEVVDAALRDLLTGDEDLASAESDLSVGEPDLRDEPLPDLPAPPDELAPDPDLASDPDLATADLRASIDQLSQADFSPQADLGCPDPGNWHQTMVIKSDSASSGTPDSYFITTMPCTPFGASITGTGGLWTVNVSNGTSAGLYCSGSSSCAITVPPGQTTLIVTAVTDNIGSYTLTITYAVPN